MNKEELIHIATIGKTIGLKGEMKLNLFSDFPEQFKKNATFETSKNTTITISKVNHSKPSIFIEGVDNVDDAKKYTNVKIYSTRSKTKEDIKLRDGEYFYFDLIGSKVYEGELLLGVLSEIDRIGINNYFKIDTTNELQEKGLSKFFLLPYLDKFVLDIDIENKVIKVKNGLDILEES